jgi:hypothetical protein
MKASVRAGEEVSQGTILCQPGWISRQTKKGDAPIHGSNRAGLQGRLRSTRSKTDPSPVNRASSASTPLARNLVHRLETSKLQRHPGTESGAA